MANSKVAEQPKLFINVISIYQDEDGTFSGAFAIVKANFATSDKQLNLLEGCPMYLRPSTDLPFIEEVSKLEAPEDKTLLAQPARYELDAHVYRARVARYTNPETGEVEPRVKQLRTKDGELVPDKYVDNTVKVFITLDRVVTSAPEWA